MTELMRLVNAAIEDERERAAVPCMCLADVTRVRDYTVWRCACVLCGHRWTVMARPGDAS